MAKKIEKIECALIKIGKSQSPKKTILVENTIIISDDSDSNSPKYQKFNNRDHAEQYARDNNIIIENKSEDNETPNPSEE